MGPVKAGEDGVRDVQLGDTGQDHPEAVLLSGPDEVADRDGDLVAELEGVAGRRRARKATVRRAALPTMASYPCPITRPKGGMLTTITH
jgi:hypothetical protein